MIGNRTAEIKEYQRAAALGLRNWDLFLNLGLAQLENGDLEAATDSCDGRFSSVKNIPNHISISPSSMSGVECWRMRSKRHSRRCS